MKSMDFRCHMQNTASVGLLDPRSFLKFPCLLILFIFCIDQYVFYNIRRFSAYPLTFVHLISKLRLTFNIAMFGIFCPSAHSDPLSSLTLTSTNPHTQHTWTHYTQWTHSTQWTVISPSQTRVSSIVTYLPATIN